MSLGARTTPSVVAFAEDGTRHVGDVAKRQVCTSRLIALQGTIYPEWVDMGSGSAYLFAAFPPNSILIIIVGRIKSRKYYPCSQEIDWS